MMMESHLFVFVMTQISSIHEACSERLCICAAQHNEMDTKMDRQAETPPALWDSPNAPEGEGLTMSPLEGDHDEDHHAEGDGGGDGAASGPDWVVLSETAGAASNTESHHHCTNIDPQVHAPLLQAVLRAGLYCLSHKLGGGLLSLGNLLGC
jgi:hypothetical protein